MTRKRATLILGLLPALALMLSSCTSIGTMTVDTKGRVSTSVEMVDSSKALDAYNLKCEDLIQYYGEDADVTLDTFKKDKTTGCRLTTKNTKIKGVTVLQEDGQYTLMVEGNRFPTANLTSLDKYVDMTLTVTMPGEIIEATGDPKIDGNTATYTDFMIADTGFTITSTDSHSTSRIGPIAIGIIVLLLAAAAGVVYMRRRAANDENDNDPNDSSEKTSAAEGESTDTEPSVTPSSPAPVPGMPDVPEAPSAASAPVIPDIPEVGEIPDTDYDASAPWSADGFTPPPRI